MDTDGQAALRAELCRIGARLYQRGLITASDGNLSARLGAGRILISPSGRSKGSLRPEDLVVVDLEGEVVEGSDPPSTDTPMHREVYRRLPDTRAVIHAHPPFCTALTVAGRSFPVELLPEALLTLGEVPTARPALPGSDDAEAVAELIEGHDALLLGHHGALTWGAGLEEALIRMERLEHVARVYWLASVLGGVEPLPASLLEILRGER